MQADSGSASGQRLEAMGSMTFVELVETPLLSFSRCERRMPPKGRQMQVYDSLHAVIMGAV